MSVAHVFRKLVLMALCGGLMASPHRFAKPTDAHKTPESALASIGARVAGVESLAVEARASVYADGRARKGTLEIALEKPASLFFAVLSPTGDMLSVLASDGTRFASFERGAKFCVTGCSTPENIARLIPLALEGSEAVSVLLGVVPTIKSDDSSLTWSETEGTYIVTLRGGDGAVQRLWVEHGTGAVRRSVLIRGETRVLELSYDKYESVQGQWLPHRLRVKMAQDKTDLQLDYRDVEVNPMTLTKDTFRLGCPAGTKVRNLGCAEVAP